MSESSEKVRNDTESLQEVVSSSPSLIEPVQETECASELVADEASTGTLQSPEALKSNYLPEKSAIDYDHSYKMVVRRNYNHLFLSMGFWMVFIFFVIVSIGFFFLSHTVSGK